ncbi:MAG TPA: bifunctional ADP-dependent NAD(P)H-hydrate dehydratase/NAD(P)H-hydrate epimerase [Sphingobium sp.]|uniref:NAD(P)H-hydrate dehydratase n=1 Tax=Sphingobium sp. TaxID=1912891 RepID=UPI000ED8147E|nr:NAD(P)H-hydrate dehydratase [Sphingobium sp.]HAF40796.1 bifunctional ADP-dependent NAD(P)H-hydrate dehydratase/NAD(P)H-hydrate epimerase [Sphingobium sp.]
MTDWAILTAAQMRAAEQGAFDAGVDEYSLMETAGAAAAEIIWRAGHRRDALVLCGPGNNGGDGFVIARLLRARGVAVRVAALGESRTVSSQRARAAWGGPVEDMMSAAPATQLIDALFGTGLTRSLDATVASRLCALAEAAVLTHAVDLPSGVETDSGALLSAVPIFGICIALGAYKPAHLLHPAAGRIQRLILADIGIAVPGIMQRLAPPLLEAPVAQAHKYNRGLVAVIGGGMAGASLLASIAAAHSGAGTVRRFAADRPVAGPHAIVSRQTERPEAIADALADERINVVLVGPGLGLEADGRARLDAALDAGHPMVLDADALTLLGEQGARAIPAGAILTPHEGEFQRLFGDLPGSKIDRALAAAQASGSIVVYKGADSVIAAPDGRVAVASGASPWLSTAGTGDVLAGLAAGRLAVTGDSFRAACEAVWLHGDAARRAGPAFVADDLLGTLPAAIAARL